MARPSKPASWHVKQTKSLKQAQAYVGAQHNQLGAFDSLDHFVLDGEALIGAKDTKALLHHLLTLRVAVVQTLWQANVFIGVSVVDDMTFHEAKLGNANIAKSVLQRLTLARASSEGFVIYPLHGFGLETPRLLKADPNRKPYVVFKKAGYAVTAQTLDATRALTRIQDLASALGAKGKFRGQDFHHYERQLKWLTRNPLLIVRLASHTGAYYENQFIYMLKIRLGGALIAMLSALADAKGLSVDKFESTATVNRLETLDIKHYLVGEAPVGTRKHVELLRIPMNLATLELALMSDLQVTIASRWFDQTPMKALAKRLSAAIDVVEQGHLQHVNLNSGSKVAARVYARIVTALEWYRRSNSGRIRDNEAVVSLAVAFETLLTDHYEPGVTTRLETRVRRLLKGRPGVAALAKSVVAIYKARSAIVHTGSSAKPADTKRAREAFIYCFEALVGRLGSLPSTSSDPIGDIIGS